MLCHFSVALNIVIMNSVHFYHLIPGVSKKIYKVNQA